MYNEFDLCLDYNAHSNLKEGHLDIICLNILDMIFSGKEHKNWLFEYPVTDIDGSLSMDVPIQEKIGQIANIINKMEMINYPSKDDIIESL
jgi:hypothetical protein